MWQCAREGSCCTQPQAVTVTVDEARLIIERQPDVVAHWRRRPDGFLDLLAKPCPYVEIDGPKVRCTVYDIRPYNCRRFQCGRHDPHTQPFQEDPMPMILSDRLLKRSYAINQRKAQRWADAHGWKASA